MWFGTRDGLNRYDGHEMRTFRHIPGDTGSLSDNYITCAFEDDEKTLWVGTLNGLNSFDPQVDQFTHWLPVEGEKQSLAGNTITSIHQDRQGRLWVGTNDGMSQFDRRTRRWNTFRPRYFFPEYAGNDRVNALYTDSSGLLWLGTNKGLLYFDTGDSSFKKYVIPGLPGTVLIKFIVEEKGKLWLGTQSSGLFRLDPKTREVTSFRHEETNDNSLSSNMIESLLLDRSGKLWVGTINGGLNLYNAANGTYYHYEEEPENTQGLSKRTASALFEDREGNFWVGTHRGGVNLSSPYGEKFTLYRKKFTGNTLSYNDINGFCEDHSGNIWIGTDGGGLNYFNRQTNTFSYYRYNPYDPRSLGADEVLSILEDSLGDTWVATWGGGLNRMVRPGGKANASRSGSAGTGRPGAAGAARPGAAGFIRYKNDPLDSTSISSNYVQSVLEDSHGKVWVATYYGGLNQFDRVTGKFRRITTDPSGQTSLYGNNIVSMAEDPSGKLWFGTDDGGLNCYDPEKQHFYHYFNDTQKKGDLRVIFIDKKGRIWIGQQGLYLFDPTRNTFNLYTRQGGLATVFIKGIAEDAESNFWISTSRGLIQFNPADSSFKKYNTSDGLQGLEFENNSCLQTRDGEMFFGGLNGFNTFYPSAIRYNRNVPPVYITELQIFNEKVLPGGAGSILRRDISQTDTLVLSHNQSSIAFNFAALNYTNSENNQYAYKLEGFDKDWHYSNNENKANYTNLDPGEYVFRVKASNNDGVWNEKGNSIRIVIDPPFWKTSWFLFLLSLLMVCSVYAIYLQKRKGQLKKMEERKREELVHLQLQFFTNISHELRTPLMLILGPAEKLLKEDVRPAIRNLYQSIHRNASRLLFLINELMDYRKLQAGALKLQVVPGNLNSFLEEVAGEFHDWAAMKSIHFAARPAWRGEGGGVAGIPLDIWYDRQVLEKIVLNLLSNAFKYTNTGGTVELDVLDTLAGFKPSFDNEMILLNERRAQRYIYIRIRDNGIGISGESIKHLFERYFRVSEYHLGSGIGLAFVKSLVLLHKGDIYVYSERHRGTEIIVGIPLGEENYGPDERWMHQGAENRMKLESLHNRYEEAPSNAEQTTPDAAGRRVLNTKHILVTDDNEELRRFIRDCLAPYYSVTEAADGADGLLKARDLSPDLVISDVMMPIMNGNDFCKAMKQDIETSHIPFIMLTAKDADISKLEGVEAGADFYFSKPVNVEFLLLTIRNIFDQRQKLREHYTKSYQVDARDLLHSSKDAAFMDELLTIIDGQLMNPDLDIEFLCRSANMSRSKLYEKIKAITGQATGDFIRTIRLKKAVDIMLHEDVSLMEIACRVGIQTQSYFTKAFKKQYGKTPMQFMQELVKK
jgi:ligand-binding sensor domain-containing protein/signal transduction histidine kinase/AraC-like DNA-binding protein